MNTENDNAKLYEELERLTIERNKVADKLGFPNIDDKAKYEEVITGNILNHDVFRKASGEVKGADARNKTGGLCEYKKESIKSKTKLANVLSAIYDSGSNKTYAGKMTYNGAGGTTGVKGAIKTREIVNSYNKIDHYLSLFYKGECIIIAKINTDYVTSDKGLMKRVLEEEKDNLYSSTNGNGVLIHFENGGLREGEGEIVFKKYIEKPILESYGV